MHAATAGRVGPTCVLAALVGVHAGIQITCVSSASVGVDLSGERAALALALTLAASAAFASRFTHAAGPDSRSADSPRAGGLFVAALALGAVVWAAAVWGRLWLLAAVRPSYDWDGLYYHIPAIHAWVVAGRVAWIDALPDIPFVNYPMGIEANTFLLHQVFGLSALVDACNLWYWPLAFVATVVLAELLGARGPWRWFAGALVAGAPVVVCQGVTSYTDPAAAACVMAAFAASLRLVFDAGKRRWWNAVLWGASLGLVLGAKGTGLPIAAVLAVAALVGSHWRQGRTPWTTWLAPIAAGVLIALAVGGYWYARNAYHTGNPVHPIEVRFGARVLIEGYDAARFTQNNLPAWLERVPPALRMAVSWLQLDAPIEGYAPVGGLGYIWPIVEIPAIFVACVLAVRGRAGLPSAQLGFTLALAAVLLAIQPAAWWSRFTVWIHVVGLACVAAVLAWMSSKRSALPRLCAVLCGLVVVGVAAWESERTLAIEQARGRVEWGPGGTKYASSAQALFPGIEQTPGLDALFAADAIARSRWGRSGTLLGGILSLPLGQRGIVVLPDRPLEPDLEQLDRAAVRWVIWDVAGAGHVPAPLRERSRDEYVYAPAPDRTFHVLRLADPAP